MSNITKSSFTSENALAYADIPAVLAGLARMRGDIWDLANEIDPAIAVVNQTVQAPGDKSLARQALKNQQAQLVWLAAETGAMLAALAHTKEATAMPAPQQQACETSTVLRLYNLGASLDHLCATLPEEQAGLALLLRMISAELDRCAADLDEAEG